MNYHITLQDTMRHLRRVVRGNGICSKCNGSGLIAKGGGLVVCDKCGGTGKE